MSTLPSTVSPWRAGRLARRPSSRTFGLGRDLWVGAVLLVAAAVVFALFVSVLERDVNRSEIQHAERRVQALEPAVAYDLRSGEPVPDAPPQEPVDAP